MKLCLIFFVALIGCKSTGQSDLSGSGKPRKPSQPAYKSKEQIQRQVTYKKPSQEEMDAFRERRKTYFEKSKDMHDYFWNISGDETAYGNLESLERAHLVELWDRELIHIFEDQKPQTYQAKTFTMGDKLWNYCASLTAIELMGKDTRHANKALTGMAFTSVALSPLALIAGEPEMAGDMVYTAEKMVLGKGVLYFNSVKLYANKSIIRKKARMAMRADKTAGFITSPYRKFKNYMKSWGKKDNEEAGETP